jgi:hypothetical protein
MSWPLSQEYNEAIQSPAVCFADAELRQGQVAVNALGLPMPCSGNFADVYQVYCPTTGNTWAVKCFTRQVVGQRERYAEISRHLQQARLPFTVEFQYLEHGIRVAGSWYPVLKMRWVEGLLLNDFVRANLDRPGVLHALGQIWLHMAQRLSEAGVAHGDLQHGNVILVPGSKTTSLAVKLIDYDGMYVPALASSKSGEVGHPNYQHPQRLREATYNAAMDGFSVLVVATALRALEVGGTALWQRYDNGENLLFTEADFRDLAASPLFAELRQSPHAAVRTLAEGLEKACRSRLEEAPLLEGLLAQERPPVTPPRLPAPVSRTQDWDFAPARPTSPRRRQGRVVPAWVWAASAGAALLLIILGVFFGTRALSGQPQAPHAIAPKEPAGETPLQVPASRPQPPPTTRPQPPEIAPPQDNKPPTPEPNPGPAPPPVTPKPPDRPKRRPVPPPPPPAPAPLSIRPKPPEDRRFPVPDPKAYAKAEKELHNDNQGLYASADKGPLASKLYDVVNHGSYSSDVRYVAWKELLDLAAAQGDTYSTVHHASRLGQRYQVNPLEIHCRALEGCADKASNADTARHTAVEAWRFLQYAVAQEEFDLAGRLALAGTKAATRARSKALLDRANKLSEEFQTARREYDDVRPQIQALARDPNNPEANLAVGRYRCCSQDNWEDGLPLLAKGSDAALRELAVRDLQGAADAAGRHALGDGWFDQAGHAQDAAQEGFRRRAHYWYKKARPGLAGDALAEVDKRLQTLAAQVPELKGPWGALKAPQEFVRAGLLHLARNQTLCTRRCYRGAIEVTVEAMTTKKNIRLFAGDGAMVVFNGDFKPGQLEVHIADAGGLFVGSGLEGKSVPLIPNQFYTLRWRLTPNGMTVWVSGKEVFRSSHPSNLSLPRPVGIQTTDSAVAVKSFVVEPLRQEEAASKN